MLRALSTRVGSIFLLCNFAMLLAGVVEVRFTIEQEHIAQVIGEQNAAQHGIASYFSPLVGRTFSTAYGLSTAIDEVVAKANADIAKANAAIKGASGEIEPAEKPQAQIYDYQIGRYKLGLARQSAIGLLVNGKLLFFSLAMILGILGGALYVLPHYWGTVPGIKHDGIFHTSATNRGAVAWVTAGFMTLFYIALYKAPWYLVPLIALADPMTMLLVGHMASEWDLYGLIYTIIIAIMGVRMFFKYRHSAYHTVRTASVVLSQVILAYFLPKALEALRMPAPDLKMMWPLDYTFFYSYRLKELTDAGTFGVAVLVWGIALFVVAVPVMTYFFGKRWYCSWVCGCGGLAETLGDPYRQNSSKTLRSWKIERWMIHSVLLFALIVTGLTLGNFFSNGAIFGSASYQFQSYYSFAIGFVFSGLVGTGFYPLLGNRPWCRFGCPLAAYLGLVQRLKSRFRITVNGGQCISCGNCSTYCEMGIDVRSYAQRGENIVRASCVGCGVCAAVCPRGVLALENGPSADRSGYRNVLPVIQS